jgi:SAM-dependent methyltransferase
MLSKLCNAFTPVGKSNNGWSECRKITTTTELRMDPITSLRTEWISAALCTNQIPRAADVCVQLGAEDGRIVTFVPRTIRQIITSSLEPDGTMSVSTQRRLKQSQERRKAATIKYVDQRADDLKELTDESVDVVVSLQAAQKMHNNGLDWKKSIREAARVLKPGGRFLFVENTEVNNENYLEYVQGLYTLSGEPPENPDAVVPIFDVSFDEIDLVLSPHIAGVAFKSEEAGLAPEEVSKKRQNEEKERLADLSIAAYERGIKKRRRKKNTVKTKE